ncbi:AAA domain-containing protein [Clostridium botulinum C/D]|nr:AAA domain-containing protein [Clostridium botulinum C/D]NFF29301.1 AAA family ATPase [Clostridium botulinum]MCD3222779.1 AAA domain-containing protein [Clostridium botulinum C/D]MCD3230976.1 AAA domain-containing protein [Clostridium botulinum C/D]MCD3253247.1 AAA domain-containing protein [Clostridium botulinum C/D]
MTKELTRSRAVDIIEERLVGYRRTAYQFACQLGLECRADRFKIQNYLFSFDDDNLRRYLNFWFKMYVTPNPYVNSKEEPICIFKALAEEILASENKQIGFNEFCTKYFGDGKSSDILKNAIQAYGNPIKVSNDIIYLTEDKIDELNLILKKVNDTLPMNNNMDEIEFFNRFSYEQFCKYYNIPYSANLLDNLENKLILKTKDTYAMVSEEERLKGGMNVLLYGVPGSGKSWTIQHEYCNDESVMERLVFHPDYTYSDFVGQILPKVDDDGKVSYVFTPGPFTTLLREAYTHPNKEYFLVIEEINRGNAPAIFGEVFQLLDRKMVIQDKDDDGYPIGTSEYPITNVDIAKVVYKDSKHKVRIPSNMSIIGTMNTSDQNVFTLDTAFQRRWNMRLIENSFKNVNVEFANQKILDTAVTWKRFCTAINEIILDKNVRMTSSEDKRLGTYFVHLQDLIYDNDADNTNLDKFTRAKANRNNRRFPEKVIKYLWDDAFKFSREEIFEVGQYNSLEAIIRKFMQEKENSRFSIFKQNVFDAIVIDSNRQNQ